MNLRILRVIRSWAQRLLGTVCIAALFLLPDLGATLEAGRALDILPRRAPFPQTIRVETKVISSFGGFSSGQIRYGKLDWLGGLELISDDPLFGGLSGLAFVDDQRFLAIGDNGIVFAARLQIEAGRPVGLDQTTMRYIPGLYSRQKKWQRDAEGLDVIGDEALVSFEGDTRIVRYRLANGQLVTKQGEIKLPRSVEELNIANKGLEAVAVAPEGTPFAGAVLMLSEKTRDERILGWISHKGNTDAFSFPASDGMRATGAAFTSSGDLVILERKFSILGGLVVQLRRIKADAFGAGELQKTDILLRANFSNQLDNMEGLDIRLQSDGSSLISLISDDNFNSFQSTLLLQFVLPAGT